MPITISLRNMHDEANAKVEFAGYDTRIMNEADARMFGLRRATGNYPALWGAIKNNMGRPPNTLWLNDPTECANEITQFMGKAYGSNKWAGCTITKKPVSAKILSITSEPKALTTKMLDNRYNSDSATLSEELGWDSTYYAEVSDTSHWEQSFTLTVGAELGKEAAGYKATFEFSSTTSFGQSTTETKGESHSLFGNSGVSADLPPYSQKAATLYLTKGVAVFEVEYDFNVQGDVYIYFASKLLGKHHHTRKIDHVLGWMGKPVTLRRKQKLVVGTYTDGTIGIADVSQIVEPNLIEAFDDAINEQRWEEGVSPLIDDLVFVRHALLEACDFNAAISKADKYKDNSGDYQFLWKWAHNRLLQLQIP